MCRLDMSDSHRFWVPSRINRVKSVYLSSDHSAMCAEWKKKIAKFDTRVCEAKLICVHFGCYRFFLPGERLKMMTQWFVSKEFRFDLFGFP